MKDHNGQSIAKLGEVLSVELDWRTQMRLAGVDRRARTEPDRGYIEQPGEGALERKTPVILPDSQLRRRIEVSPTPVLPTACVRPEPGADYEPAGSEDELEELKAIGRELESQRGSANETTEPSSPPKEEQTLVLVKRGRTDPDAMATARERAVGMLRAGELEQNKIAAAVGVSQATISRWSMEEGFVRKREHSPELRAQVVSRVLDKGERQADLAREMGIHKGVVSTWVTREQARREREMSGKPGMTRQPANLKIRAVARLRELERIEGKRRGQPQRVARELGVEPTSLRHWADSGDYDMEELQKPAASADTLMSRPGPPPVSQPAPSAPPPVTAVQPVPPPLQNGSYPYAMPPQPPQPPPWWQPMAAPPTPPSAPAQSTAMMGLEEYIKRMVEHEVQRQVPLVVQATLRKMWGQGG